jgi:hypothetical protein
MKIFGLSQKQQELKDQLFFLDDNDIEDEEDIAKLKKELMQIRGDATKTLIFLYRILQEAETEQAARHAIVDHIKKGILARAQRREKTSDKAVERLSKVILHTINNFGMHNIELPDGSILNRKLNPGRLVFAENFDVTSLPADYVAEVPAHLELKEGIGKEITALLRAQILEGKKLDQVTTLVQIDELPGVMLIRDEVVDVR